MIRFIFQLVSAAVILSAFAGNGANATSSPCLLPSVDYSALAPFQKSQVIFTSCSDGADAPHVVPINQTTYDWWYFDVVSPDAKSGVTFIFMAASEIGFPFSLNVIDSLSAFVFVTVNGSTTIGTLLSTGANITSAGNGSSGYWKGTGLSWTGKPDVSRYVVSVDNSLLSLSGTVTFDSVAPGHYPCSPLVAGVSEEAMPHLGWSNVIPDANSVVDLTLKGNSVKFTGYGYHDKNWGDKSFVSVVKSWYWGHGRLGPYSVVFFDSIGTDGKEYVSGYLAKDGEILSTVCSGVSVRPVGKNFPPTLLDGAPTAFSISFELESGETVDISVNIVTTVSNAVLTYRWLGTMNGTVGKSEMYSGACTMDSFVLSV
ncbi:hypothetical protein V1511DRAFT_505523 [Dipodascopsis uninucleata]